MSQLAGFSAFNGDATPVEMVFVPIDRSTENGTTTVLYRTDDVGLPENCQVSVTITRSTLKSGVKRTDVRTVVPNYETPVGSTIPVVISAETFVSTQYTTVKSDTAKRRSARHLHGNVLLGQNWTSAAIASGNIAEVFDLGAVPV